MPQELKSGQDVTALMPGQDVTALMGSGEAPAAGPPEEKPSWLTSAMNFASGVGQYYNPITVAKGIYGVVTSPIETVKGLGQAQIDQFKKGKELYDQGRYVEAAGHALAGALPLVGPEAANIGEEIGQGNIAHGLGRTTGLLSTIVGPELVKKGIEQVQGTAPAERLANWADTKAGEMTAKVMTPQLGPNKTRFSQMAKDVGPAVAAEPGLGALSVKGLAGKIEERLNQAADALDEAAATRNPGAAYPTAPIVDALKQAKQQLVAPAVEASQLTPTAVGEAMVTRKSGIPIGSDVLPAHNATRAAQIDQAINELQQLGPLARYDALKQIRQSYDQVAKIKYSPSVGADFLKNTQTASGAADVAGTLREALAGFSPETAAANRDYALWKKADTVMKAAEEVQRARPTVGRTIMARMAGTIAGGAIGGGKVGELIGFVLAPLLDSASGAVNAGRKIMTARVLSDIGVALKSGDASAIESALLRARKISLTAGTVGRQENQQEAPQ